MGDEQASAETEEVIQALNQGLKHGNRYNMQDSDPPGQNWTPLF